MNRRLRVLLIGRRYWPHGSFDAAGLLVSMASALHRHGVHVEVLTPRYASSWPDTMVMREIQVHRPIAAPRSDWTVSRYVRQLTSWLRQKSESFDLLFVDSIREEAIAAIEASRVSGCPTVLLCGGWGTHGDPAWWNTTRAGRRCAAIGKMSDAVVSKSAACDRVLLGQGYSPSRMYRIEPGFSGGPARSAVRRSAARKTLTQVNGDLHATDDMPVILCNTQMSAHGGVDDLIKAARHLVARHPELRLWLVGDGPLRGSIYDYLRGEGLRSSIAMPGTFCDHDDLLAAADVYVQTDDDGLDWFFPSAVSAEVPLVSVDSEAVRSVIGNADRNGSGVPNPSQWIRWYSAGNPKSLRSGLVEVLSDHSTFQRNATQLRRELLRSRPQSHAIEAYIGLFERLVASTRGNLRDASAEAIS